MPKLAACKTLARKMKRSCLSTVQFGTGPKRSLGHLPGAKKINFLSRGRDDARVSKGLLPHQHAIDASRYEAVDRRFFRVLREGGVRAERVDDGAVAGVGLFELVVDA